MHYMLCVIVLTQRGRRVENLLSPLSARTTDHLG